MIILAPGSDVDGDKRDPEVDGDKTGPEVDGDKSGSEVDDDKRDEKPDGGCVNQMESRFVAKPGTLCGAAGPLDVEYGEYDRLNVAVELRLNICMYTSVPILSHAKLQISSPSDIESPEVDIEVSAYGASQATVVCDASQATVTDCVPHRTVRMAPLSSGWYLRTYSRVGLSGVFQHIVVPIYTALFSDSKRFLYDTRNQT